MGKFYRIENKNIILQVRLQPASNSNRIVGVHGDYLKIKIKAKAVEGKANAALLKFLAQKFSVARQDVVLIKGKHSKYKQIIIYNVDKLPAWLR